VAYLPLAYVDDPTARRRYADGHLLGAALALPKDLDGDLEQEVLDILAAAIQGGGGSMRIGLGRLGAIELASEVSESPAVALRQWTWTRAVACWGSVTPISLDRMAPRRHDNHDQWAMDQIVQSCLRQGLPRPETIQVMPTSPHLGAPVAAAFPALLRKDGTRRWHLHAHLRFPCPVRGPLVLGAGRYLGYGLCKPLAEEALA
jgi:CRISPR-associated protein Csb2